MLMRLLLASLACGAVGLASADDIVITVSGESASMTLANALTAYNGLHGTSYSESSSGSSMGTNRIVKRGDGELVFSANLTSWKGDLIVEEGQVRATCAGNVTTVLGNTSTGAVYVRDGATVMCDATSATKANGVEREIHIVGSGARGRFGALVMRPGTNSGSTYHARSCVPKKLILDGDATVAYDNDPSVRTDIVLESKTVNFGSTANAFTLTMRRTHVERVAKFYWAYASALVNFGDDSHLVFDGISFVERKTESQGKASNTITFRNGGSYYYEGAYKAWPMTLVAGENNAGVRTPAVASFVAKGSGYEWLGPIRLDADLAVVPPDAAGQNMFRADGVISGVGALRAGSDNPARKTGLFLEVANEHSGGTFLSNVVLSVNAASAVSTNGPAFFSGGSVEVRYANAAKTPLKLGKATFSGAVSVAATSGTVGISATSVERDGTGELTVTGPVQAGVLSIAGGGRVRCTSTAAGGYAELGSLIGPGTLDLGGGEAKVGLVTGFPTVENGSAVITSALSRTALAFGPGSFKLPVVTTVQPSYGSIAARLGTTLDLSGRTWNVPAFEGVVKASGGTLRVLNSWRLTAAEVMNEAAVLEGVELGADVEIDVSDIAQVTRTVGTDKGYLLAKGVTEKPKLSPALQEGWTLRLDGGDLYLKVRVMGLAVIGR